MIQETDWYCINSIVNLPLELIDLKGFKPLKIDCLDERVPNVMFS